MARTLSIIRFRNEPGDVKDIGFIFFAVASGLASGVGLCGYGMLFVIILHIILFLLEKRKAFVPKNIRKTLKIMIYKDLNYQHAFDDIIEKYTKSYKLTKIKTTDLVSLFELVYSV